MLNPGYSRSVSNYRYKCEECGVPIKHRNCRKYPNLCKSDALKQMQKERREAKKL